MVWCQSGAGAIAPRVSSASADSWTGSVFSCELRRSTLALLVPRVAADDHDAPVATDHLAAVTDRLDAREDLHVRTFSRRPRPRIRDECRRYFSAPRVGPWGLLVAVGDPAAAQVVRGELHDDPVLREDANVVLPHLARDVGEHFVTVA